MRKKTILGTATIIAVLSVSHLIHVRADSDAQKAAQEAAESWLGLVDQGKYGESWDEAATLFKGKVPREKWVEMVGSVRNPLGPLVSRKLAGAEYREELPGAPDGKYVILKFETAYEHKKTAVETVTPMLDNDGRWRVSGYFIR